MAIMQVDVVSAERRLFSGEANEVYARSPEGEFGILPGHQPALIGLGLASPVRIKTPDGQQIVFAVHAGFLEFRENHLTVLADTAEVTHDIDVPRAEAAKRRAQDLLERDPTNENAQRQLARADLRLRIAEQFG
jgi:F-type H+-transporting ATPase subunit epsilon